MKHNWMIGLGLMAAACGLALVPQLAAAATVGNVISSTPVLKRVTEPRRGCVGEDCRKDMITEDRLIGYKVVYEYAGKQHEVQLPFAVGSTIPIEVAGDSVSPSVTPTIDVSHQPVPVYAGRGPVVVERVYREPVYVEQDYYARSYYPAPYYYSPLLPLIGLSLGWHGGHHWGGHRHGGHHRRWR